jgi:TolA-binding protein
MNTRGFIVVAALLSAGMAQTPASNEEMARRQLESGRTFLRQGNVAEALRDFRAVADRYGSTAAADDALLELARYYLDTAGNVPDATTAVDAILAKYSTSDSAAEAYVLAGRLALARSRRPTDLKNALANFERVVRLFPSSAIVPRALQLAGETLYFTGQYAEASTYLSRLEVEHASNAAVARGFLTSSRVLVAQGDPIAAMEDLQQIRNRWPSSPEAAEALARLTLLHRLYVRAPSGAAYAPAPDTVGPARLDDVVGMVAARETTVYVATNDAVTAVLPDNAAAAPAATRPRGLALDRLGRVAVLDGGTVRTASGDFGPLALPRSDGLPKPLAQIDSAAQFSTGEWLIVDGDSKGILRFSVDAAPLSVIGSTRVTRIAVNDLDEIAGFDRDRRGIGLWDPDGNPVGLIPFRGSGYQLDNPEALAFDGYGHLYVLDRTGLAVFGPHPAAGGQPPTTSAARGAAYRLLTIYTPPERDTTGLRRATAFAIDRAGTAYVHDDRARRILVLR